VVSELMNQLQTKNFQIISVTTDGFITNCPDPNSLEKLQFGLIFSKARFNLVKDNTVLELKKLETEGIIS